MLRRKIAAELERWLKSAEQKALFITGSRQIGKSYSIRAFGKANHATYIELNLMENRQAKDALLEARNADDFISRVTLLSGKSIAPGKTLVFIDEVQEAPDIMTMAKFLVEDREVPLGVFGVNARDPVQGRQVLSRGVCPRA